MYYSRKKYAPGTDALDMAVLERQPFDGVDSDGGGSLDAWGVENDHTRRGFHGGGAMDAGHLYHTLHQHHAFSSLS